MTTPIGFPPETIYNVIGISQDVPGIVSLDSVAEADAFYLVNGMTVTFSGVQGMTQVNRERYIIGSLDTDAMTFALYTIQGKPVDTGRFNAYIAGGQINIVSYPAQAGQPPGLMYNNQPISI